MVPAKTQCPTDWTVEYVGYLMSEYHNNNGRSMYECVNKYPECVPGLNSGSNPAAFLYLVEPMVYLVSLGCRNYDRRCVFTH